MGQILNFGGGWFSDRSSSTGSASVVNTGATKVMIASLLVVAGTGALVNDVNNLRQQNLNRSAVYGSKSPTFDTTEARTSAEDLAQIRNVLSPAISDLANIFGVSRQSIYNWLAGEQTNPEHGAKLRDLALAADIIEAASISVTGAVLKRKIVEGKTLFEIVRDGGSAMYAADVLVSIVRRETEQREMMAKRFAGRQNTSRSVDSDFPAENDGV